jgi:peroxiredoxin
MGKSKFQNTAKKSIQQNKLTSSGQKRPKYYDEDIIKNKKSKSSPAFAIFVVVMIIIGASVFGVGSYLDNQAEKAEADANQNLNPNYTSYTSTSTEQTSGSSYKTDISITTISGQVIKLSDHVGKVVILYFHFLTCSACHSHSPNLKVAMASFTTNQLVVIAITVQPSDSIVDLNSWATTNGYTWNNVRDSDYSLSSRFGAAYTPHTVYIGKDGDSSNTHTGVQTTAAIKSTIDNLLSK